MSLNESEIYPPKLSNVRQEREGAVLRADVKKRVRGAT